ncbi:MAG: hypothetical protein ACFFCX_09425 [Candidatus Sifarchaeia archaeon]
MSLRLACEIAFALFVTSLAADIVIEDPSAKTFIIGILLIFGPIWLFAIIGTNILTLRSPHTSTFLNRADIGILITVLGISAADAFSNLLFALVFIYLGLFIRLSTLKNYKQNT